MAHGLKWVLNGIIYNAFSLALGVTDFPRRVSSDTSNINIIVISACLAENSQGFNIAPMYLIS